MRTTHFLRQTHYLLIVFRLVQRFRKTPKPCQTVPETEIVSEIVSKKMKRPIQIAISLLSACVLLCFPAANGAHWLGAAMIAVFGVAFAMVDGRY